MALARKGKQIRPLAIWGIVLSKRAVPHFFIDSVFKKMYYYKELRLKGDNGLSSLILNNRYEIIRPYSRCGETIVYMGQDKVDGQAVIIKEFFSESIMKRDSSGNVHVIQGCEVQYKSLSSDYEELCNYLKSLPQDSSIVKPVDVIRTAETVYAVEKCVDTETLDDYLARCGHTLSWAELKKAITSIIGLLSKMHSDGVFHRGISPETILVDQNGRFLLSGLCIPAARTADSEIASTLYFGYSAPEQYSSSSWQGSWSDVYSVSAVCYKAITGTTPVEWRQRGKGRELTEPRAVNPDIPKNVSDALIKGLAVDLRNRFHSVEELWYALLSVPGAGTTMYQVPVRSDDKPTESKLPSRGKLRFQIRQAVIISGLIVVIIILSLALSSRIITDYIGLPDNSSSSQSEGIDNSDEENDNSQEVSEEASEEPAPEQILIPNLMGINIENILLDPLYQSLFTFNIERDFSETQPIGYVISQLPLAGAKLEDGRNITVWVSKGSEIVYMPDLLAMTLAEASEALNSLEIEFDVVQRAAPHQESGTVVDFSLPIGGIIYRPTDRITIYIAE